MTAFNLMAPINDLGYGIHARGLLQGLREINFQEFHLTPLGPVEGELTPEEREHIRAAAATPLFAQAPTIKLWHEFQMDDVPGPCPIAYPVWETTGLQPKAVRDLKKMKGILVATQWAKGVMEANIGTTVPVHIVNEAGQPLPVAPDPSKYPVFTFLHVGKFEFRKGTVYLLKIYGDLFESMKSPTRLVTHCFNPFDAHFVDHTRAILQHLGYEITQTLTQLTGRRGLATVEIPLGRLSRGELGALYAKSHIGLYPSCGEGWNLDLFESLTAGLPCVASFVSGHTEYARPELGFPPDLLLTQGQEAPAQDGIWFHGDKGNWTLPNPNELREVMLYAYLNHEEILRDFDPTKIRERFTWKNAARQFLSAVESISGGM